MSQRWQRAAACVVTVVLAACGGASTTGEGGGSTTASTGPPYQVSSDVLRDEASQEVRVWAPVGKRGAPVVYALPGMGGHGTDFDLLGSALAARGVVVFATDYRANGTIDDIAVDTACGYRLARRVAPDYGGDLARPVTGVGWSRGASLMLSGALHRTPTGAGAACARDLPLPEVVVGMNGCYYEWAGRPQPFPVEELDRREADVLLVAASADRNCPAWQSTRAAAALRAEGFRATVTTIPGANHFTPLFHDLVDGSWVADPGGSAGEQAVQAILDAIEARH